MVTSSLQHGKAELGLVGEKFCDKAERHTSTSQVSPCRLKQPTSLSDFHEQGKPQPHGRAADGFDAHTSSFIFKN